MAVAPAAYPAAPDRARYKQMTPEQRCATVAPRAVECVDEVMIENLNSMVADPELSKRIEDRLRASPRATGDTAQRMHELDCLGWRDSDYADAVLACWETAGCKAFAACVTAHREHP